MANYLVILFAIIALTCQVQASTFGPRLRSDYIPSSRREATTQKDSEKHLSGSYLRSGYAKPSSWIREANTTLVLPAVPDPVAADLCIWPGMETSGGDLIQGLAFSTTQIGTQVLAQSKSRGSHRLTNCQSDCKGELNQWCVVASTLKNARHCEHGECVQTNGDNRGCQQRRSHLHALCVYKRAQSCVYNRPEYETDIPKTSTTTPQAPTTKASPSTATSSPRCQPVRRLSKPIHTITDTPSPLHRLRTCTRVGRHGRSPVGSPAQLHRSPRSVFSFPVSSPSQAVSNTALFQNILTLFSCWTRRIQITLIACGIDLLPTLGSRPLMVVRLGPSRLSLWERIASRGEFGWAMGWSGRLVEWFSWRDKVVVLSHSHFFIDGVISWI